MKDNIKANFIISLATNEFLVFQSHRVRRKYEISAENGRLFLEFLRNLNFPRFSLNIKFTILLFSETIENFLKKSEKSPRISQTIEKSENRR